MTYREFQEDVNSWFSLRDFCEENGLSVCHAGIDLYGIVDDGWLEDYVNNLAHDYAWDDIYRLTSHLENSGYGDCLYYDYGDGLEVLDDECFEMFKECTLEDFRASGLHFDDEDEEEEEEEGAEEPPASQWWNCGIRSLYGNIQSDMCDSQPDIAGANFSELSHFLNGGALSE